MNTDQPQESGAGFFRNLAEIGKESSIAAEAGRQALARVVHAVWTARPSGQSNRLVLILASLYNGSEASPIDLANLTACLDWNLKKDICAVILGKGLEGFADYEIREEFRKAGGEEAVDWLHWHTTGGAARAALTRLVRFCLDNRHCSTAKLLRTALRSLHGSGDKVDLGAFSRCDNEITDDFVLLLDATIGPHHQQIVDSDIAEAFEKVGGTNWFFDDQPATSAVR